MGKAELGGTAEREQRKGRSSALRNALQWRQIHRCARWHLVETIPRVPVTT